MASFPSKLKFPQDGPNPITCGTPKNPPFNYLLDISCESHNFISFVNDDDYLQDEVYYFMGVHLIIPKYLGKVRVAPLTGELLNDELIQSPKEINQNFAMGLRMPNEEDTPTVLSENILFDEGLDNCGIPPHSMVKRKGKDQLESNIHQFFFKFHNHFFVPIILSNGQTCYYIFENPDTIKTWVETLSSGEEYAIAINRPIEYSNILRIGVTRLAKLIPLKTNPE